MSKPNGDPSRHEPLADAMLDVRVDARRLTGGPRMPLMYTAHAAQRMQERRVSENDCEEAIKNDRNPWEEIINGGNHKRYFHNNVTVITNVRTDTVVTVWTGDRGGW
jgi:hypothetical protein